MRYFLCIFLSPVAVLISRGGCGGAVLNSFLTLCGIIPGIVHAFFVVNKFYADNRHAEMVQSMRQRL